MSNIFKLNKEDLIKGLVVTVVSAVLTAFLALLQKGFSWSMADLTQVGVVALTAGLSYLLKNFASDEDGKVLGKI